MRKKSTRQELQYRAGECTTGAGVMAECGLSGVGTIHETDQLRVTQSADARPLSRMPPCGCHVGSSH